MDKGRQQLEDAGWAVEYHSDSGKTVVLESNWVITTQAELNDSTVTLTVSKGGEDSSQSTPTAATPAVNVDEIENSLKLNYGLDPSKPWADLCGTSGMAPFPCEIASMSYSYSNLHIRVQESLSKTEAKQYARNALQLLCLDHKNLSFVIIENGAGMAEGQAGIYGNPVCGK